MEDRVQIRFILLNEETHDEKTVCFFHTNQFAEWMKMLTFCKKHNITLYPNEFDDKIDQEVQEKLAGLGAFVDELYVKFGSDESIQCVEVYLK